MTQSTSRSMPLQDDDRSSHHTAQITPDHDVPIDPSIAASRPTYPAHGGRYSPSPIQQDMQCDYPFHPQTAIFAQPRPVWAGYTGHPQHPMQGGYAMTGASPPTSAGTTGLRPSQSYSPHKRPRRRYEEIERIYKCGWRGCKKAYGTLKHLNAHVTSQSHGQKRSPEEFKENRKEFKDRAKEEKYQRKANVKRAKAAAGPSDNPPADGTAGYQQGRSVPLPPIGYQPGAQVPSRYQAPAGVVQQLQDYECNGHMQYSGSMGHDSLNGDKPQITVQTLNPSFNNTLASNMYKSAPAQISTRGFQIPSSPIRKKLRRHTTVECGGSGQQAAGMPKLPHIGMSKTKGFQNETVAVVPTVESGATPMSLRTIIEQSGSNRVKVGSHATKTTSQYELHSANHSVLDMNSCERSRRLASVAAIDPRTSLQKKATMIVDDVNPGGEKMVGTTSNTPSLRPPVFTSLHHSHEATQAPQAQHLSYTAATHLQSKPAPGSNLTSPQARSSPRSSRQYSVASGIHPESDESFPAQEVVGYDPSGLDAYLKAQAKPRSHLQRSAQELLHTQIWAHVDPRKVWVPELPASWIEEKRKEITARGGKKANWGKVITAQNRRQRVEKGWNIHQCRESKFGTPEDLKRIEMLEEMIGIKDIKDMIPAVIDGVLCVVDPPEEDEELRPESDRERRVPRSFPV